MILDVSPQPRDGGMTDIVQAPDPQSLAGLAPGEGLTPLVLRSAWVAGRA